jgi:prepilin-type N-terminal cleavage/methylation domain-containing protein
MSKLMSRKGRKGFTLVELAVVIVIIGVLASFGVPKFMQSVERSKASEAFNFLSACRTAQERYQAKEGKYAATWGALDISWKTATTGEGAEAVTAPALQYFTLGTLTASDTTWACVLTRAGSAGTWTGYTVGYTQDGFDLANSSIPAVINPMGKTTDGTAGSGS